jgi:cytochrome c oxidase subunit IV
MSDSHHIIPFRTLLKVFLSLIGLTVITVLVSFLPLGPLDMPVAIAIAVVKASLVVLYFMALKYDKPVNTLTFSVGTLFVVVFITFTLFDTAFRGDLGDVSPQTIQEINQEEEAARARSDSIPASQMAVSPADRNNTSNPAASDTTTTSPSSE